MEEIARPSVAPRKSLAKIEKKLCTTASETNGDQALPLPSPKPIISRKPAICPKPKHIIETISGDKPQPKQQPEKSPQPQSPILIKSQQILELQISAPKTISGNSAAVKVCNKLKISANDLNKLRFRTDLFESHNAADSTAAIYDVREDEEQIAKMAEIAELLVAGGYFRARIKGLHNFDKIIGGMCWAIQMCNVDLDIDIFYQETLSIGQKIALTEKIVSGLRKMKCPFKLEPHQIQGLDCIHIFPVIQWLVKKSFETRQQTSEYIRSYATWQFNRCYRSATIEDSVGKSVIFRDPKIAAIVLHPIKAQLRRRFVHPARDQLTNEDVRTRTTMLEYGVYGLGAAQRLIGDDPMVMSESKQQKQQPQHSQQADDQQQQQRSDFAIQNLLESMTPMDDASAGSSVASGMIGSILSGRSDEISRLSQIVPSVASKPNFVATAEAKLKSDLAARKAEAEKLSTRCGGDIDQRLAAVRQKLTAIDARLTRTEPSETNEIVEKKLSLAELLAALRKQKSQLRQYCRDEKRRLDAQLESLSGSGSGKSEHSENNRFAEIDAELGEKERRHDDVRRRLATIAKRHATMQRKFDDIPTRSELAQYQKRFLELYNQLSNKHNETKKFYTLYNTLAEERMYLEKEFNLINSILDNFQKAHGSGAMVKDEFLVKFEQIVDSIVQNKNKVEQRSSHEKAKRDQLDAEYMELVDQQRAYFTAVKQFKEECRQNEQLLGLLENSATR